MDHSYDNTVLLMLSKLTGSFMFHVIFRSLIALVSLASINGQAETLIDIYGLALKNDPTIKTAEANYGAGKTIRQQALAVLLPQIDASYTRSWSDTNNEGSRFIGSQEIPSDSDTETVIDAYSVSIRQSIFNPAAIFGYKQSKALTKQAEIQFNIEQQSLILRATEAYFNVLRGQDNLTSALAEEKAIAQQLEQTRQRYEVGLIAITDVHEAQAAFDLSLANRLTEEVNLGIASESLAFLTDQQHGPLHQLSNNFPIKKPVPEDVTKWVTFANENNLSIQLAEQLVKAANGNANVKKSASLPVVEAVGRYSKNDSETDGFDTASASLLDGSFDKNEGSTIELRVNLPIFSGGTRTAQSKEASYQRVAEQSKLIAAKRQAIQDTRSNYLTTVTDTARVNARKRAITSSQSALDATQAGYDVGTRNIVDLLNAQRDLYRAQRDYANSRYDYVINSLRLKQAAGTINPKDIQEINEWLEPPASVLKSQTPTT